MQKFSMCSMAILMIKCDNEACPLSFTEKDNQKLYKTESNAYCVSVKMLTDWNNDKNFPPLFK